MSWIKKPINITRVMNLFIIVGMPFQYAIITTQLEIAGSLILYQSWFYVLMLVTAFIALNLFFLRDIKRFINYQHEINDVYKEFLLVFSTGISNILIFSGAYFIFGINNSTEIIINDWQSSIYFSVVTWTTLGYGDFSPVESLRLVAALEAFMGYVYMALLLGLFLSLIKVKVKN